MIHNLRGTVTLLNETADDIEVGFTGTYEYTREMGPTAACGGQPPESELIILDTDPAGYESEVHDIVLDDPSRYYEE